MSATISTQPRHRVPLATGLAIAGVVVAAGALGFAWDQSHDDSAPAQAPVLRTPTLQDLLLSPRFVVTAVGRLEGVEGLGIDHLPSKRRIVGVERPQAHDLGSVLWCPLRQIDLDAVRH